MSWLGQLRYRLRGAFVARFRSYGAEAFAAALQRLGVARGDALMVHASLHPHSGYTGRPADLVRVLKEAVGPEGLLVMPSMTYSDSTKAFLLRGEVVRQRTSASRMGLLSEVFRRGKDVRRSLSPAHPLLAWGADAEGFVAGHEKADRSFGEQSPFHRLLDRDAKVLCIDSAPESVTFTHHLEDRHRTRLPFALYDPQPLEGRIVDAAGQMHVVPTYVLSDQSRRRRREEILWRRAARDGLLRRARVGNTTLLLMRCRAMADLTDRMFAAGESFFVADGES